MKDYIVKQGESLSLIAAKFGVKWKDIYDHPENAEFKTKRPNPNIIFPGDKLKVPEPKTKQESLNLNKTNTFKMKAPKNKLKLALLGKDRKPMGEVEYKISLGKGNTGKVIEGKTDSNGNIDELVDRNIQVAQVEVFNQGKDSPPITISVNLHKLDPITTETGVQSRLKNLGYYHGKIDGQIGDMSKASFEEFQSSNDLVVDGWLHKKSLKKLQEVYKNS